MPLFLLILYLFSSVLTITLIAQGPEEISGPCASVLPFDVLNLDDGGGRIGAVHIPDYGGI